MERRDLRHIWTFWGWRWGLTVADICSSIPWWAWQIITHCATLSFWWCLSSCDRTWQCISLWWWGLKQYWCNWRSLSHLSLIRGWSLSMKGRWPCPPRRSGYWGLRLYRYLTIGGRERSRRSRKPRVGCWECLSIFIWFCWGPPRSISGIGCSPLLSCWLRTGYPPKGNTSIHLIL